jgi:hypothetical protein
MHCEICGERENILSEIVVRKDAMQALSAI